MMNPLSKEHSPYLKQHAHNPVHWYPWGKEALEMALSSDKPILVSVGYSTCHWCHVMAHESFEDEETAALMNKYFINIKIDREERPDLDNYFMEMVQMMGFPGGWPLHVFLTPQLECFFGGTYFPPQSKYGRPSWVQVLESVHQAYRHKRDLIKARSQELRKHFEQSLRSGHGAPARRPTYPQKIWANIEKYIDDKEGGFGNGPKFPQSMAIQQLFLQSFFFSNQEAASHALESLKKMCLGGIFDHVQGGFCRYSVDGQWNVPHFEKMLYDHALIMGSLSDAYSLTGDHAYKYFALKSHAFFEENMKSEIGLYYAAMDADSEGEEGKYYVWTEAELKQVLADQYGKFADLAKLNKLDHFHPDKKVIRLKGDFIHQDFFNTHIAQWDECCALLSRRRMARTAPAVDHKQITAWNALMISAFVKMYRAFGDESFKTRAIETAENLVGHYDLSTECEKIPRYVVNGQAVGCAFLEDFAYLIQALIDLHGIDHRNLWLGKARSLMAFAVRAFKTDSDDLFSDAQPSTQALPMAIKTWNESSLPNANAVMANNLRRFYLLGQFEEGLQLSEKMLMAMQGHYEEYAFGLCSWVNAAVLMDYFKCHIQIGMDDWPIQRCIPWLPEYNVVYSQECGIQLCHNGVCHLPVKTAEEIVTLFRNAFS